MGKVKSRTTRVHLKASSLDGIVGHSIGQLGRPVSTNIPTDKKSDCHTGANFSAKTTEWLGEATDQGVFHNTESVTSKNPFQGLDIDCDLLKQQGLELNTNGKSQSAPISQKLCLRKRDKMKNKKEKLLNKLQMKKKTKLSTKQSSVTNLNVIKLALSQVKKEMNDTKLANRIPFPMTQKSRSKKLQTEQSEDGLFQSKVQRKKSRKHALAEIQKLQELVRNKPLESTEAMIRRNIENNLLSMM